VDGVLSAIGISFDDNRSPHVRAVGDAMFLTHPATGKPIYSFTMQAGVATLTVASALKPSELAFVHEHSYKLVSDKRIAAISSLLAKSLETNADRLQAFIAAWASAEIFVNTTFKDRYEAEWLHKLQTGTPVSAQRYFDRLRDVMKDKYRLADKFLIIASLLSEVSATEDMAKFIELKTLRDNLLHGQVSTSLPVQDVQQLVRKYLRLHLQALP
jgi:hypothetical protein